MTLHKTLLAVAVSLAFAGAAVAGPNAPLPFLTHWTQVNAKHVARAVKEIGAKSLVVSSDLGQSGNMTHPDGLEAAIAAMKREGIADEEIDLMMRKNPARLLGLND